MSERIKLLVWETILSDKKELYFQHLEDFGSKAIVQVADKAGQRYEITIDNGCYLVSEEEFLVQYWGIPRGSWTFIVEGSQFPLAKQYDVDYLTDQMTHYVIPAFDICVEILAEREPLIRKL